VVIPEIHLRQLIRRGGASLVEGSLVPYLLLAGALQLAGFRTAVIVTLVASVAVAVYRQRSAGRVSGILVLSLLTLTARTAFAVATGSATFYFLQPVAATALVGGAFAVSALVGRPLAWRLASDFVAIPDRALDQPHVGRFFRRLSLMWSGVQFTKAVATVWLLWTVPLTQFVLLKGLLSIVLVGGAIGLSLLWFRRAVTHRPLPVPALTGA
jgi:hypothetical protein